MSKRASFNGTHLGIDGVIICTGKRITFISKSTDREVLKRWYYKDIGNVYVDIKEDVVVIEFYESGKRVMFTKLSDNGFRKIKSFIDKGKE